MAVVRLFVKLLDGRDAERELRKLLKRHGDKVLAVAIVLRAENDKQAGALVRHYDLKVASVPASLFLTSLFLNDSDDSD